MEQLVNIAIARRFDDLGWHDAALGRVTIYHEGMEDRVSIAIGFTGRSQLSTVVTFRHCAYVQMDIDLIGRQQCSDHIATAYCSESSPWLDKLKSENPQYDYKDLLHFKVELISPGGILDVLARDFIAVDDAARRDSRR